MGDPTIELLGEEWARLDELCGPLDESQWKLPVPLPGWTVQDALSHVIGIERMIMGDPAPEVPVDHLPHLHDPVNAGLETWVEARRPLAGAEVLAEFRQVVLDRRLAQLRAMTDADMDKVGWSPVGEVPYREFMQVRVFDCWLHEQDMRAGLGQPGHDAGPVVDAALARFIPALGFVVGKKAGAPDGSSVVFEVHGPVARTFPVVVDGRAKVVDTVPADPTVVIGLPLVSLALLGGGRWSLAEAEAAGGLTVEGDEELGRRVLSSMAFTP